MENNLKIGIAGLGCVGGTLYKYLLTKTKHEVVQYDPPKGLNQSFIGCDAVFICVPVPHREGFVSEEKMLPQDLSIVYEVFDKKKNEIQCPILMRSTVTPGTCDALSKKYNLSVYSMPEFLTARRAEKDFSRQDVICSETVKPLIDEIFGKFSIRFSENMEGELGKIVHNCFGALKVSFFNMIYDLCVDMEISYPKVLEIILSTGYINKEHTKVPGPDLKFGYGGVCFPTNMKAFENFLDYGMETGYFSSRTEYLKDMIGEAIAYNNGIDR